MFNYRSQDSTKLTELDAVSIYHNNLQQQSSQVKRDYGDGKYSAGITNYQKRKQIISNKIISLVLLEKLRIPWKK